MANQKIGAAKADLVQILDSKLSIKSGGFDRRMRRAGRKLPKNFAQKTEFLRAAENRTQHPKRRGQVDSRQLQHVRDSARLQISQVDISADRARARVMTLGVIVINLMLFALVYLGLLAWIGAFPAN